MVRFYETDEGNPMYKLVGILQESLLGLIDNGTLHMCMQATIVPPGAVANTVVDLPPAQW